MTAEDWPDVARIYEAGIAGGDATFELQAPTWDEWCRAHVEDPCLVARGAAGEVLGWAALGRHRSAPSTEEWPRSASTLTLERAGRGIGRALLSSLIDASEQAGFWTLDAGIFPENAASIALHEACGFTLVGVRRRVGRMSDGRWRDVRTVRAAQRGRRARLSASPPTRRLEMWPAHTVHSLLAVRLQSAQWHGQCPGCEAWNTLVEERAPTGRPQARSAPARGRARARRREGAAGQADARSRAR